MNRKGIDILLMQNDNQFLGGYVRYFTDIPAEQGYPVSVLFSDNDEMITITSSSPNNPNPPLWSVRGVGSRIGTPYFRSMHCTNEFDAREIVKVLKSRNDKVVGIVVMRLINAALFDYLIKRKF